MTVHFQVAEMASGSYWHLAFLRWSLVAIFIWFAIQKFTPYAAEAIAPLIANSSFMSWLGVFGVRGQAKMIGTIELTTAAILIIGSVIPIASAAGAAIACATFLLTTSFVFHHAWDHSEKPDGFPDHLDVARAVSVERHCAACRVFYAASRIFVAGIHGHTIADKVQCKALLSIINEIKGTRSGQNGHDIRRRITIVTARS